MNQKKLGIAVIVKKRFIVGIVTDGDLRRDLRNYKNEKTLNKFMSKNPLVVNEICPPQKL